MVKKTGVEVRNGWLLSDGQPLSVETLNPDEFHRLLTIGRESIVLAAQSVFDKTTESSPDIARVHYPWTFAIRLAAYEDTFMKALTPDAQEVTLDTRSNESYTRKHILPPLWPYLDAATDAHFVPRVPGRMNGYSKTRDGIYIQVKDLEQFEDDIPLEWQHKSPDGSTRWPTTDEVAKGIIPKD